MKPPSPRILESQCREAIETVAMLRIELDNQRKVNVQFAIELERMRDLLISSHNICRAKSCYNLQTEEFDVCMEHTALDLFDEPVETA